MNESFALSIGKVRTECHRSINNTIIWQQVAERSFAASADDATILENGKFRVPSRTGSKEIARTQEQVTEILKDTANRDLLTALLVFVVAKGEALLADVLQQLLVADPRRLQVRVQGVDHVAKVDIGSIVGADSIEAITNDIACKQVQNVFYASPSAQFRYLERAAGLTLDDKLVEQWSELKASRDIIVHNSGVINNTYIAKSGALARGSEGDTVSVPREYFYQSAVVVKGVTGRFVSQIQAQVRKAPAK